MCVYVFSYAFSQLQILKLQSVYSYYLVWCLLAVEQEQEKNFGSHLYLKQEIVFFLHVKIPGDIETAKQNKINSMYKKGLTLQPYILIIESNLNNVHSFYVIIDNKNYKLSTLLVML